MTTRWLLIAVTTAAFGCTPPPEAQRTFTWNGPCRGLLQYDGLSCDSPGCLPTTPVEAVDVDGCTFVEWVGGCLEERVCSSSAVRGVRFERTAWPVRVDTSSVVDVPITLTPTGTSCGPGCVLVPAGERFTVSAMVPSDRAVQFSGDCEVEGTTCVGVSDRARSITVTTSLSPEVTLTVRVRGRGTVHVSGTTLACTQAAPCAHVVPRGARVRLTVEADPGVPHLGVEWTVPSCSTDAPCELTADGDVTVWATLKPYVELRIARVGPGELRINGAPTSPLEQLRVPWAQPMRLSATADADATFAGYEGAPCAPPRSFSECQWLATDDSEVTARFQRFYGWIHNVSQGGILNDLVLRDGGIVLSGTIELSPVTSVSYLSELSINGAPGRSLQTRQMLGTFVREPSGALTVQTSLQRWADGGYDWGPQAPATPVRFSHALLEVNEATFEPGPIRVLSSQFAQRALQRGGLAEIPGGYATALWEQVPARAWGIATFNTQLTQTGFSLVQSIPSASVREYPWGVVALSLPTPVTPPEMNTCDFDQRRAPVLRHLGSGGQCDSTTFQLGTEDDYTVLGPLDDGFDVPLFQTVSQTANVHAHEWTLAQRWRSPLTVTAQTSTLRPRGLYPWRGRVLSVFSWKGQSLTSFGTPDVSASCEPNVQQALLLSLHNASTGAVEWLHCLSGDLGAGVNTWRADEEVRPLLLRDGLVIPTPAFAATPTTASWGTGQVMVSDTVTTLLGLITPP